MSATAWWCLPLGLGSSPNAPLVLCRSQNMIGCDAGAACYQFRGDGTPNPPNGQKGYPANDSMSQFVLDAQGQGSEGSVFSGAQGQFYTALKLPPAGPGASSWGFATGNQGAMIFANSASSGEANMSQAVAQYMIQTDPKFAMFQTLPAQTVKTREGG